MTESDLQVRMADPDFRKSIRVRDNLIGRMQFAQQIQDNFGFTVDFLAVARLELHAEHPCERGSQYQQKCRRSRGKEQRQPRCERSAKVAAAQC